MHGMLRLLLAVGLVVILSPAQAKPPRWVGLATQTQDDAPPIQWRVSIIFNSVESARIDYPSLKCGGVMRFIRRSGAVRVYRERIRYGREICVDNGRITVRRQGTRLVWRWTGERTPYPTMKAQATLVRVRGKR